MRAREVAAGKKSDRLQAARIGSVGRPVSGIDVRIDRVRYQIGDPPDTQATSNRQSSDTTAAS